MRVYLANDVGFCFGVKRAINLARQALAEESSVSIMGDLIHNKAVTQELEEKGLRKVASLEEAKSGTIMVRAHGLPKKEIEKARSTGLKVIDATCPIVTRAQDAARELESRGCQVIVIGDINHAEIKGILGALEKPAVVVNSVEELRQKRAEIKRKVGIVFQTTHSLELMYPIVYELLQMCLEVQVINTICRPVQKRQDDAVALAQHMDVMIVVGSRTSANTTELAHLCQEYCPRTYHIETAAELKPEHWEGAEKIGIASGLSTPEYLVEEVYNKLQEIARQLEEQTVKG